MKSSSLRSTYICPIANSASTTIPSLQFVGFLLDCIIVQIVYRLVDDGISMPDDWTIHLQDGTSNHFMIGLTLIVCHTCPPTAPLINSLQASSLVLLVAGIVVYPAMPEHREWIISLPSEYLLGLLRLSLMIPFMTLCFLKSVSLSQLSQASY